MSGIYSVLPQDVAYRLARPEWWYVLPPVHGQPCVLASAHAAVADNLDAANQSVSSGHRL